MCRAFSCIITKKGDVVWQTGIDSHDQLLEIAKINDDTTDGDLIKFAKIEIVPTDGYLHPEGKWLLKVDENTTPRWLTNTKMELCWLAFEEWKEQVYSRIDIEKVHNFINPLLVDKKEVTNEDITLLKKWASVRDSVWASVWASVRDSVGDSVWASVWASVWDSVGDSVGASVGDSVWASVRDSVSDSVWAYIGSCFIGIKKWEYMDETGGFPFQSCVDLWEHGFLPCFDGKRWILYAGKEFKTVYEMEVK